MACKMLAAFARMIGLFALSSIACSAIPVSAQTSLEPIPRSELKAKCNLDPDIMAGIDNYLLDGTPYVVFRNGYYCWRSTTLATEALGLHNPREVFSTTKSFAGILVGVVAARSDLRDTSLLTDFLTPEEIRAFNPSINLDARIAHVLAMTATSPSLAYGQKGAWQYDLIGAREINILIPLLTRIIQRDPARFWGATNVQQLATKLFAKLGMTKTSWAGLSMGFTLQSTPADLARLGELVLRRGRWNEETLVEERYMYRLTHPAFEDLNTGLGYLMWINSSANSNSAGSGEDPTCAPYPRWPRYPHAPFFESPNSNGGYPFHEFVPVPDNGVVWSAGTNDSTFMIHRGLDMVIGANPVAFRGGVPLLPAPDPIQVAVWSNIRPALVANLPEFRNNEQEFCRQYRMGLWSQTREVWSSQASR